MHIDNRQITVIPLDAGVRRIYQTTQKLNHNSTLFTKAKQALEKLPQIVDVDEAGTTVLMVQIRHPHLWEQVERTILEQIIQGLNWTGHGVAIYDSERTDGTISERFRELGVVKTVGDHRQYVQVEVAA